MGRHVAIKCRISEDDERRGEGVHDQENWGRDYASRMWPDLPVEVYTDNDISAAERETHRPEFDRLCGDIRAGKVAHLVARDRNRITRDAAHWLDLVDDLLLPAGLTEIHTKLRGIMRVDDIATDFDAVLGRREVRVIRQLVRDKHDRLAAAGRPSGGKQLGYRHGRNDRGESILVVEEEEADAIRWAASAVLSGWSLTSIAAEWERRGIPRPRGGVKPWSTTQVRRSLTKATIAGWRTHHGQLVTATWEPILDDAIWRQVCAVLDTRSTSTAPNGKQYPVIHSKRTARRYLLTGGLARCDLCKAPLVGQQRRWKGSPLIAYYMCHPSKGGCSKIGIAGEAFERFVEKVFLAELNTPGFRAALASGDEHAERRKMIAAELRELEAQDGELGRLWATKKIPPAGWAAAQAELDRQRDTLSAELAALPTAMATVDPASIVEDWEEATLEEKRHFLGLFVEAVEVYTAERGKRISDETMRRRVHIEWRER